MTDALTNTVTLDTDVINTLRVTPWDDIATKYAELVSSDYDATMGAISASNQRFLVLEPGKYNQSFTLSNANVGIKELYPKTVYIAGTITNAVGAPNRVITEDIMVTGDIVCSTKGVTWLDSSGGAIAATLVDGECPGDEKIVIMKDETTESTLTIAHHATSASEVLYFNAVGEYCVLKWTGIEWITVAMTSTTTGA